eukprot:14907837-Ditylum_brightwellii.AAC.1
MSPRTIMTGATVDFNKYCCLEYGTFVHTHKSRTNDMAPRTVGAIALRLTGNVQGGYSFFSLSSGRRIDRKKWTVLPMPDDTI